MTSALIWIFIPLGLAILLYLLPRRVTLVNWVCLGIAGALALLAWLAPVEETIRIGRLAVKISESMVVSGRSFTLTSGDAPSITLLYGIAALWFAGGLGLRPQPGFAPLGLGLTAVLIAALAVEPFLYAALFFEIGMLISIPMLVLPGVPAGKGVLRFIIFQTLALPFILIAGWMLSGVETSPADSVLAARAAIMLELGFVFYLGIFPFHSWIPILAEEAHPYRIGFLFTQMPIVVFLFLLNFLDRYSWLRNDPTTYQILVLAGVLMVATGGIWAGFQHHLGRLLGYLVIVLSGFALVSIGMRAHSGIELLMLQFLPNALCLWLIGFCLSVFQDRSGSLGFEGSAGWLRRLPVVALGFLLALFSITGIPDLAGFPVRLSLFVYLADQSTLLAVWAFAGNLGLLLVGLRILALMIGPGDNLTWKISERTVEVFLAGVGILAIGLIGLLPHFMLPGLLALLNGFNHLP